MLCRKWEACFALFQPEFESVEFPEPLRALLPALPSFVPEAPKIETVIAPPAPAPKTSSRRPLEDLLVEYVRKCESENDAHHVVGKTSILCKAFGEKCLDGKVDAPLAVDCIEDLTCARVEAFVEG